MNSIKITGKIASSIELRQSKNGVSVVDFTLYHKGRGRNPVWVDVEVWGEEAERVYKEIAYNELVQVEGELRRDKWISKYNNEPKSKLKITADSVEQVQMQSV